MRQDGFVLGQDPEGGKEEAIDGCAKCHRSWPSVRFSKAVAADQLGESGKPIYCDGCFPSELETEIAQKIDEATGALIVHALIRKVEVTGIESKTNVVGFAYATHIGDKELVVTDLNVWFKNRQKGDPLNPMPQPNTLYLYKDVPVFECENWYAAPQHGQSHGTFFAERIKNSYACERKI